MDLTLGIADNTIAGIIGAVASILTAFIAAAAVIISKKSDNRLKTSNGHEIGMIVSILEEMALASKRDINGLKTDAVDVRSRLEALAYRHAETNARVESVYHDLVRHIKEVDPYVRMAMEKWAEEIRTRETEAEHEGS